MRKYRMLREVLERSGKFELLPAPQAEIDTVKLAHSPAYVDAFLEGDLSAEQMRRIGFPWSEGLVQRSLGSVGATLAATQQALERGWGGTLSGGTHHAFFAEGSGFCVFNDIVVAIRSLQQRGGLARFAVLDCDVHQGDGTAQIFAADESVLTVSIHSRSNFPFRKQQSRIDVELYDGTGDEEYLSALNQVLPRLLAFAPEILFYQAGVDVLESDTLGKLALTIEGVRRRDEAVFAASRGAGIPVVITIGGGYSKPLKSTVVAHAGTYLAAAEMLRLTA
jgi:acetoin utilization deacetylase AcuC-like enzyme